MNVLHSACSLFLLAMSDAVAQELYLRPGARDLSNPASWEESSGGSPDRLTQASNLRVLQPDALELQFVAGTAVADLLFDTRGECVVGGNGEHLLVGQLRLQSGATTLQNLRIEGPVLIGRPLSDEGVQSRFVGCVLIARRSNRQGDANATLPTLAVHAPSTILLAGTTADIQNGHLQGAEIVDGTQIDFDRLELVGALLARDCSLKGLTRGGVLTVRLRDEAASLVATYVDAAQLRVVLSTTAATLTVDSESRFVLQRFVAEGSGTMRVLGTVDNVALRGRPERPEILADSVFLSIGAPGRPGVDLEGARLGANRELVLAYGSVRIGEVGGSRGTLGGGERVLVGKADVRLAGGAIVGQRIDILDDADELRAAAGAGNAEHLGRVERERRQTWEAAAGPTEPDSTGSHSASAGSHSGASTPLAADRDAAKDLGKRAAEMAAKGLEDQVERMKVEIASGALERFAELAKQVAEDLQRRAREGPLRAGADAQPSRRQSDESEAGDPDEGSEDAPPLQNIPLAPEEARRIMEQGRRAAMQSLAGLVPGVATAVEHLTTVVSGWGGLVGQVRLGGELRPDAVWNTAGSEHTIAVHGSLAVVGGGSIRLTISRDTLFPREGLSGVVNFLADALGPDRRTQIVDHLKQLKEVIDQAGEAATLMYDLWLIRAVGKRALGPIGMAILVYDAASLAAQAVDSALHGGSSFPVHVDGEVELGDGGVGSGSLRPRLEASYVDQLASGQIYRGIRAEGQRNGRMQTFPAVVEHACEAVKSESTQAPTGDRPADQPPPVAGPAPVAPERAESELFFFEDYHRKGVDIGAAKLPTRMWLADGQVHTEVLSKASVASVPLRGHIVLVTHGAGGTCDDKAVVARLADIQAANALAHEVGDPVGLAALMLHSVHALGLAEQCEVWVLDWSEFATGANDVHGWNSSLDLAKGVMNAATDLLWRHIARRLGLALPDPDRSETDPPTPESRVIDALSSGMQEKLSEPLRRILNELASELGVDAETLATLTAGVPLEAQRIGRRIGVGLGDWLHGSGLDLSPIRSIEMHLDGSGLALGMGLVDRVRSFPRFDPEFDLVAYDPAFPFSRQFLADWKLDGLVDDCDLSVRPRCRLRILSDGRLTMVTGLAADGPWRSYVSGAPPAVFDVAWSDPEATFSLRREPVGPLASLMAGRGELAAFQPWLGAACWEGLRGSAFARDTGGGLLPLVLPPGESVSALRMMMLGAEIGLVQTRHPTELFDLLSWTVPNREAGTVFSERRLVPALSWSMRFYARTVVAALTDRSNTTAEVGMWSIWHRRADESAAGFQSSMLARLAGHAVEMEPATGSIVLPLADH